MSREQGEATSISHQINLSLYFRAAFAFGPGVDGPRADVVVACRAIVTFSCISYDCNLLLRFCWLFRGRVAARCEASRDKIKLAVYLLHLY